MPNILVEKMASGLPIACSSYGPMPEVLGDAGVYFDPENPIDIEKALWSLISSSSFRTIKARECFLKSHNYSWEQCSSKTFSFFIQLINYQKK